MYFIRIVMGKNMNTRIAEIGSNIARIDASLIHMQTSSATDWQGAKERARETADTTKSWMQQEFE